MTKQHYRTLSKRTVDRLAVDGKDALFWDRKLPGFGVRVNPSGRKVYVVQTRVNGKSRRVTVGRHGEIAPHRARKPAARLIARMKNGEPLVEVGPGPTVAHLPELWEMRPAGRNPCKSVRRYKVQGQKERFLTSEELARLGRVLDIAPAEGVALRQSSAVRCWLRGSAARPKSVRRSRYRTTVVRVRESTEGQISLSAAFQGM